MQLGRLIGVEVATPIVTWMDWEGILNRMRSSKVEVRMRRLTTSRATAIILISPAVGRPTDSESGRIPKGLRNLQAGCSTSWLWMSHLGAGEPVGFPAMQYKSGGWV